MFNWLRRWRRNRYRAIFRLWDGQRYRYVDPMVAWQVLKNHPTFDLERDIEGCDAGVSESRAACLAVTREAFGVQVFDGAQGTPQGLTQDETLELLAEYGAWMQRVKKHQDAADFLGGFPCDAAAGPVLDGTWEQHCGLTFNLRRVELRRAGCVADGIAGAFAPHAGIIAAQCDSPAEAAALFQLAQMRHSAATSGKEAI